MFILSFFITNMTTQESERMVNTNVLPVHYTLSLDLDTDKDTYTGKMVIDLDIAADVDEFSLNSDGLAIDSVRFNDEKVKHEPIGDSLRISGFERANENTLSILFNGRVSTKMEGFYLSEYGNDQKMYSSHFEPSHARKAFPCFDHPAVKATFDIDITADKKFTILSNMTAKNETVRDDRKTVIFNRMKKTSTYLIAFVIGDLQKITEGRVSVYSTYDVNQGAYALRVADQVLKFFEEYFGIEYPLDKLDMVAIPEFTAGAMENWGLITYRETGLLFNKEKSSMTQRRLIAETVAHEIAHQWFGNLVTPKWWDDLWLNEGFATWAAALGCNAIREKQKNDQSIVNPVNKNEPLIDWEPWVSFINDDLNKGMESDMLDSSHPIKVPVHHHKDVTQISGAILYSKSASLIRMVENYLGAEVFRKKIGKYLRKYSYGNASSKDLFEFLSDDNNNITKFMATWTTQTGYPLVTLKDDTLVQTRMTLRKESDAQTSNWPIPIRLKLKDMIIMLHLEGESNIKSMLDEQKAEMTDVFLNEGGFGFYRSFYDFDSNIAGKINTMSTVNRIVFVNDQIALAKTRRIVLPAVLEMCQQFGKEENFEIFDSIKSFLVEMKHIFYDDNRYITDILQNLVKHRLNFDLKEEVDMNRMALRASLLGTAVNHGIDVKIDDDIHPMYLLSYYTQKMMANNDLDYFIDLYKKSTAETRTNVLIVLGKTTKLDVYRRVLGLMVSKTIKAQDKVYLSGSLMINLAFKMYYVYYFMENFSKIRESMNDDLMSYVVEQVVSWTRDNSTMRHFAITHAMTDFPRAYERALEKAQYRIDFRKNQ